MNVFLTASNSRYRELCNYNVYCTKRYGGFDKVVARPLQWYNNDCRQNGRLKTQITSEGDHNIEINEI